MKKVLLGLLCMTLCFAFTVSCEIPESVTLKSKLGLQLSLNLSDLLDDDQKLENYISTAKIKEMMGDTGDMVIYEYKGSEVDKDVQAYLVHYPIAEMSLDLSEYIDDVFDNVETKTSYDLPEAITRFITQSETAFRAAYPNGAYLSANADPNLPLIPQRTPGDPLFTVSLTDMAKLVKEVKLNEVGLEIDDSANSFSDKLRLYIPALGIGTASNYALGTKDGAKLKFLGRGKDGDDTFKPSKDMENGELKIYALLNGAVAGTITIGMVFNWERATIDTTDLGGNNLADSYDLDFDLTEFLGADVKIKQNSVKGYIYLQGIDTEPTMELKVGSDVLVNNEKLHSVSKPQFSESLSEMPPSSRVGGAHINLTDMFNSSGSSKLEYKIEIKELEIFENDQKKVIAIDLAILVPFEFQVGSPLDSRSPYFRDYVRLDLGDILADLTGDDDLFGRAGENGDGLNDLLLENIESAKFILKTIQNDIIDGELSFLVSSGNSSKMLSFSEKAPIEERTITFTANDCEYPFKPQLMFLLKKDSGQNYATFKWKRQAGDPKLDLTLEMQIRTDINYTKDL